MLSTFFFSFLWWLVFWSTCICFCEVMMFWCRYKNLMFLLDGIERESLSEALRATHTGGLNIKFDFSIYTFHVCLLVSSLIMVPTWPLLFGGGSVAAHLLAIEPTWVPRQTMTVRSV